MRLAAGTVIRVFKMRMPTVRLADLTGVLFGNGKGCNKIHNSHRNAGYFALLAPFF
jgi:hypothetical protein